MRSGRLGPVGFAAVLLLVGCTRIREVPKRVLLITLDTTRADHLGCYGYGGAGTPNLDRLAREGALFLDASSPVSCTLPSHSTIFTGLYPPATGVRYNITFKLGSKFTTLAERFKAAGWETAAFPAAYPVAKTFGLDQGFDLYDTPEDSSRAGSAATSWERTAGEGVDRALAWLSAHKTAKSFVWLHVFDAHYPYQPPFPFSDRFRGNAYDGELAYADEQLGRLFEAMRQQGMWDDTLVVVAGDHGEGLYDHREAQHSLLAYQSTIHVPLLMHVPGARSKTSVAEPVTLADLTPTILDLCGLDASGARFQGVSLRPPLEGRSLGPRVLYFESLGGSIVHGWSSIEGVRDARFKLLDSVKPELYDLERDPGESDNLFTKEPERAAELAGVLAELKTAITPGDATAEAPDLSPEARARLASLGYVGGTGGEASKKGPAPQDLIYLATDLSRLQSALSTESWSEAAETSAYVLTQDPTGRFALFARAVALSNLRQGDAALRAADELLSHYGDSPSDIDLKGEVLVGLDRMREAAAVFRAGREKFPDAESLAYHEGLALYESGERAAACQSLIPEALTKVKQKSRLLLLKARCEAAAGQDTAALATLREAVDSGLGQLDKLARLPEFRALAGKPGFPAKPKS